MTARSEGLLSPVQMWSKEQNSSEECDGAVGSPKRRPGAR